MKRTSSTATTRSAKPLRNRHSPARHGAAPAVPEDADARRARAWLNRAKPQSEIVRDDAVPAQSREELEQFRPASYHRDRSG